MSVFNNDIVLMILSQAEHEMLIKGSFTNNLACINFDLDHVISLFSLEIFSFEVKAFNS